MRRLLLSALPLAALCLAAGPPAFAESSVYTRLDLKKCRSIAKDELGGTMKCQGYKSYPVYFTEGDLRQSMRYGPAAQDLILDSFESFTHFNSVNETIEWRLDAKGKPIAAIQRWFIDAIDPDTGESSPKNGGQVLVVSRVAQPGDGLSCVVGYVDALANPDPNELARQTADAEARDFACGYQEPVWNGVRSDKAGEPMRHLPDRLKKE